MKDLLLKCVTVLPSDECGKILCESVCGYGGALSELTAAGVRSRTCELRAPISRAVCNDCAFLEDTCYSVRRISRSPAVVPVAIACLVLIQ
jgi:hypothetical protein